MEVFICITCGTTSNGLPKSDKYQTGVVPEKSRTAAPLVLPSAATRTGIVTPDLASLTGCRDTLPPQRIGLCLNARDLRICEACQT